MTTARAGAAEAVLVTSMMRALSVFRWVTLGWAVVGVVLSRSALVHPIWAVVLLGVAAVFTAVVYMIGRRSPLLLVDWRLLALEAAIGLTLLVGDGLVFSSERSQSLAWAWPAAGIAAVGIATAGSSKRWIRNNAALAVGVLIGAVSLFVEIVLLSRFTGPGQIGAAFSKIGLWLVVGLLVGPLMARLLRAERLISVVKAREDLARELHDGVLQTLAVVQRRSSDAELAALARDQENSLRVYLSDARLIDAAASPRAAGSADEVAAVAGSLSAAEAGADLGTTLRLVAASAERLHNFTVQVVVAADCPPLSPTKIAAISGVVTEALTNAAKHGNADRVTVFAEPDEDADPDEAVFVSVRDNGTGFNVDDVDEGIGMSRSMKGRIDDVGGRVEISSRPGKGTEVKIWV